MLFKLKTYFQFLSKASNQHRVHSPFVYRLVTLCFYNKPTENTVYTPFSLDDLSVKRNTLLLKILVYFQVNRVLLIGKEAAKQVVFPSKKNKPYTCVYFSKDLPAKTVLEQFKSYERTATDRLLLIVEGIHTDRDKKAAWLFITAQKKATVTIDTYQQGLVFFRPTQEKEHFSIRV